MNTELITCTLVSHLWKEIVVQKTWNKKPTWYLQVLSAQSYQTVVVLSSNIASEITWLCHELYLCISPCQDLSSQIFYWVKSLTSQSHLYSWTLLTYHQHPRANLFLVYLCHFINRSNRLYHYFRDCFNP